MRKNSPRKWVHALLDVLPLLILPIFALAVRSDNNFQPIEVQAQDYEVVNFNQYLQISNYNENFDVVTNSDGSITMSNISGNTISAPILFTTQEFNIEIYHKYYFNCDNYSIRFFNRSLNKEITFTNPVAQADTNINDVFYCYYLGAIADNQTITFDNLFFDLSQMFGVGNEPTAQQVKSYYPLGHYDYTLSHKELLNVGTTTYNDNDVGSQMVYTLYNATDKYFNMNSVFNLNSVWSWIQLNIFNGNIPLVAYVIWQVIIYEFIVDILFIFYSFFMFLIDFCEYLLEKPFNKINRGK